MSIETKLLEILLSKFLHSPWNYFRGDDGIIRSISKFSFENLFPNLAILSFWLHWTYIGRFKSSSELKCLSDTPTGVKTTFVVWARMSTSRCRDTFLYPVGLFLAGHKNKETSAIWYFQRQHRKALDVNISFLIDALFIGLPKKKMSRSWDDCANSKQRVDRKVTLISLSMHDRTRGINYSS